jgi:hypothetical protein
MPKPNERPLRRPFYVVLSLILFVIVLSLEPVQAQENTPTGNNKKSYLPFISKPIVSCAIPGVPYETLPMIPPPTNIPAAQHPDINLALRGYEPTNAYKGLVEYDGASDPKAPQLDTLFANGRLPTFTSTHLIHRWDWDCGCPDGVATDWDVTLLGMGVSPGETIHVPDSGYDIGGGYDVHVLYASQERVTLKYTGEDNVVSGYTVHVENVCVEPRLLALYNAWNAAGRDELPALYGGQAFGRALGNEIRVSIRDAGSFLDPRSHKDWWQNK